MKESWRNGSPMHNEAAAPVTFKAKLNRIIWKADDSPYFVAAFTDQDTGQTFTATGYNSKLNLDSIYELTGHMVQHRRYGRQLSIDAMDVQLPRLKERGIAFLASERFPGIGRKTAARIFEELGDDALVLIHENPDCLDRLALNSAQKQALIEGIQEYKDRDSIFVRLVGYGLSEKTIQLLRQVYKEKLEEVLAANCFDPYFQIRSFRYTDAVKIADGMRMPVQDPRRLEASVFRRIQEGCYSQGNTYLTDEQLYAACGSPDYEAYHAAVQSLMDRGILYFDQPGIYPKNLYAAERQIVRQLHRHSFKVACPAENIEELIASVERKEHIQYDVLQKEAISQFFSRSMMILNGGPGTGKSTTVKGILDLIRQEYPSCEVQLAAPTGRASKRLADLSDMPARTIHSLLKYNMDKEEFMAQKQDLEAMDFLIIDEFSMVDTWLFASLLRALPPKCRLLMIGDEDQLPSVSPGQVFNDMIDSGMIEKVSLKRLYRQSEGSGIAVLAHQINREEPPVYQDGVIMHDLPSEDIALKVMELVRDSFDPDTTQILAPKYQGAAGIDAINESMQNLLNPFDRNKAEIKVGVNQKTYREGDKVLLKKNMAEHNVFNGDIGTIIEVDQKAETVVVDFEAGDPVTFQRRELSDCLSHAWCISIHKAQGSEFQHVILVIDPAAGFMLDKRLLYTAVSRAKKRLDIVGSRALFEARIQSRSFSDRQTGLKNRLISEWNRTETNAMPSSAQTGAEDTEEIHLFEKLDDVQSALS